MATSLTSENSCNGRNDIPLLVHVDGEPCSHFRLREFENRDGGGSIVRLVLPVYRDEQ